MSHPITEEKLLAAGYKQYPVPMMDNADRFYCKGVQWISGNTKYSIGVYHYDLSKFEPDKPDGYKVEGRFQKTDGNYFVVDNQGDYTLEEHEDFFEGVWGLLPSTTYLEVD